MSKSSRRRSQPRAAASQSGPSERKVPPQLTSVWKFFVAWWGPMLLVVTALGMLSWTWETWPDVQIDFGVERYVPWRLMQGEVLYRDIACYNGPLSPYFLALCFSLFGASLRTLVYCNLVILTLLVALLYYVIRQVSRPWVATAACAVFLLLFAFAQYLMCGNYNYVCPYAHEMTHGLLLSLVALVAAWSRGRWRLVWATACGLALGLLFLTKAEVFLPGAAATVVAIALSLWWEPTDRRHKIAWLACFLAASVVPVVVAFLALASAMPARQALVGTLGSWVVAVRSDLTGLRFFRQGIGADRPFQNIWAMVATSGLYALIVVPAGLLGLRCRRTDGRRTLLAVAVFLAVAGVLGVCWSVFPWLEIARPFPLLVLLAGAAIVVNFLPHRHEESAREQLVRRISLLVFALFLLSKILLNARIYHYGFVLAMPASLLLMVAALDWVPTFIDRRGGSGGVFRAAVVPLILGTGLFYLSVQAIEIGLKNERVGLGADGFWADARGAFVNRTVAEIARRSSSDTTLAVLPEGIFINCLTGLRNPTPYCNLLPIQWRLFGEEQICEAFRKHPPDLIALVQRDTSEFGFPFFGCDYLKSLGAWVKANYRQRMLLGAPPFEGPEYGILLLEKNDRARGADITGRTGLRGK